MHECARPEGSWSHIDERFLEGRRRHILEEYGAIKALLLVLALALVLVLILLL